MKATQCCSLIAAIMSPALFTPLLTAAEAPLLVLLQGEKLEAIRTAVRDSGATLTHDLPIISAVGARMNADQLAQLSALPFVERVIDDLAYSPEPEVEDDLECPLAGSLALRWQGPSASWTLFNKGPTALKLDQLNIGWPPGLGQLLGVTLEQEAIPVPGPARDAAPLSIGLSPREVPADSSVLLGFAFEKAPENASAVQNDIKLSVRAGADCTTELVPSYELPAQDSYFPTVSGASLLHRYGVTGQGVTVAVLDSGLWESPAFVREDTAGSPRILARYDAILGREVSVAVDESGHGTHMTSVIANSAPVTRPGAEQPSYRGVAPDARLVTVKAFDRTGEAGFLDIIRGLQWVVEHREQFNIRVLNLSFASRPRWPYYDDPVNQAVMRAWEAGIVVIAAAGNEGPEPMTIGAPGNLPYIITVGAITDSWTENDRRDDYLPDFSSRGPTPSGHIKPDVVAYGGHIIGELPPGASLGVDFPEYRTEDGQFVMTGTSQAAAVVSGLAALLIQAEPEVSNDDIKCMLMTSAQPAIASDGRFAYSPFLQGSGLVNVSRAITLGERGCGNTDLNLAADLKRLDFFVGPAVFPDDGSPPTLPGQEDLISATPPEKGLSASRRWGAADHVERLEKSISPSSPIDWIGRLRSEEEKMRALAAGSP
jgi:serine protease AprX